MEITTLEQTKIEHRFATVNGVRLHYVEAGKGPLVLMLHGFPECWYSWHHQIPALAAAGYRAVAVDMRGYNLSDKPNKVWDYRGEVLARDIADLIDALGEKRATVVGHDWGGAVAWLFASYYPEKLERLVVMNCPHPATFAKALRTSRKQVKKSWYMFMFQVPVLPERAIAKNNFAWVRSLMQKDPVRRGAFSSTDIDTYVDALSQPGALTGAVNYYRAVFRYDVFKSVKLPRIEKPVFMIWGDQDKYIGVELAEPNPKRVPNCRVHHIPNASHWVQVDAPAEVNRALLGFLGEKASN